MRRRRSLLEMSFKELEEAGVLDPIRIGGRTFGYRVPEHGLLGLLGLRYRLSVGLLSVEDVAVLLGLHHRTVRTLVRTGELPCVRVGGKSVRFLFGDIMRWVEARRR